MIIFPGELAFYLHKDTPLHLTGAFYSICKFGRQNGTSNLYIYWDIFGFGILGGFFFFFLKAPHLIPSNLLWLGRFGIPSTGIGFGYKLEFRSSGTTMYDGIVLHLEYQILKLLILFSLRHGELPSIWLVQSVLGARRMVML